MVASEAPADRSVLASNPWPRTTVLVQRLLTGVASRMPQKLPTIAKSDDRQCAGTPHISQEIVDQQSADGAVPSRIRLLTHTIVHGRFRHVLGASVKAQAQKKRSVTYISRS